MIHILYHANCADGFAASCIAHRFFKSKNMECSFTPVSYEDSLDRQLPSACHRAADGTITFPLCDHLVYLDYTPPAEIIAGLTKDLDQALRLCIIDHHGTKAGAHENAVFHSVFDTQRSGAALTWLHYFPGSPLPRSVELLQYYDLGFAFQPPEHDLSLQSKSLVRFLMACLPRCRAEWLPYLFDPTVRQFNEALDIGQKLYRADLALIRALVGRPSWIDISGIEVPSVNHLPHGLLNDACSLLLEEYPEAPFAACWHVLPEKKAGLIKYSLRSRKGGFNVADLAAAIDPNGGGHPQAAGFVSTSPVHFI